MIIDMINGYLNEKGFRKIGVNVQGVNLHYVVKNEGVNIVAVLDCPTGTEFTTEQYKNIRRQIYNNFVKQNYINIRLLSIVCSDHVENVRNLCEGENDQWFIDTDNYKLIIYENQEGEFLGLRRDIENILLNSQMKEIGLEADYNGSPPEEIKKPIRRTFISTHFTKCNSLLILINVLVYLYVEKNGSTQDSNYLLESGALFYPAIERFHEYYRLLTYMFLHSGFEHIANNMIILLVIGDNLERATGKWKYAVIYFCSGVIAGIASLSYNMINGTNAISVGASGAIFGVVGAMTYIVIVNKGHLENISSRQIILFVVFSLYGGLTSQGIDNAAHIGGLIAGIVLAAILYRKPKRKQLERG